MDKYVVYGAHGVCEVKGVVCRKNGCASAGRSYYMLRPAFEQSLELYVPVDGSAGQEQMRPILSQAEIDEIISSVRGRKLEWTHDFRKRTEQFRQILSRRDEREILQMISCLYLHIKESGKTLTSNHMQLLNAAQKIIEQEFAFSLKIEPREVGAYIQSKLELTERAAAEKHGGNIDETN